MSIRQTGITVSPVGIPLAGETAPGHVPGGITA